MYFFFFFDGCRPIAGPGGWARDWLLHKNNQYDFDDNRREME